MANHSLTIGLRDTCGGGEHLSLDLTLDGAARPAMVEKAALNLDNFELMAVVLTLLRNHLKEQMALGLTLQQALSALQVTPITRKF